MLTAKSLSPFSQLLHINMLSTILVILKICMIERMRNPRFQAFSRISSPWGQSSRYDRNDRSSLHDCLWDVIIRAIIITATFRCAIRCRRKHFGGIPQSFENVDALQPREEWKHGIILLQQNTTTYEASKLLFSRVEATKSLGLFKVWKVVIKILKEEMQVFLWSFRCYGEHMGSRFPL